MKYAIYVIFAVAAGVLLYVGFFYKNNARDAGSFNPAAAGTAQVRWETKVDEQPPVTVTVTPVEFGKDAKMWKFEIALDTHSGDLDDDLLESVSLVDDKGNAYRPVAWEGPGPGGHHREGVLTFNPTQPLPEYIEIKIKNVGGVTERSFRWNVN